MLPVFAAPVRTLVLGLAALRRDSVSGCSAPWTFGPRDSRRRLPGARWRGVILRLPAATRIADARRGLVIGTWWSGTVHRPRENLKHEPEPKAKAIAEVCALPAPTPEQLSDFAPPLVISVGW